MDNSADDLARLLADEEERLQAGFREMAQLEDGDERQIRIDSYREIIRRWLDGAQ